MWTGEASWKLNCENNIISTILLKSNKWEEKGGFRYFKLQQTGLNSSGNHNLSLGSIELYGTILETENCKYGFIRTLNDIDLENLFKNRNTNKFNHDNNNSDYDDNNNDNDDDSIISYTNPNALDYDENQSECYSDHSFHSMANESQNFTKNVPGNILSYKFPLGFSSTHRINILSKNNYDNNGSYDNNNSMKNIFENMNKDDNISILKNDSVDESDNSNETDENKNIDININDNFNKKNEDEENLMKKSNFLVKKNILGEKLKLNNFNIKENNKKKSENESEYKNVYQKGENSASFFSEKYSI